MMKKIIFLFLVVVAIFGCTQKISCDTPLVLIGESCCLDANDNGVCDSNEKAAALPEEKTEPQQEVETQPVEVKENLPEMNASIKELLTKAFSKVKSMSYSYFGPPNPAKGADIVYKAPLMKIAYASTQYDDRKNPFDTVYLNLDAKTAKAYCKSKCDNGDIEIQVNYDTHYKITPLEILETMSYAVQTGTERIDNKETIIIEFTDKDDKTGTMSVEKYYGLPLKIEYAQPISKIEYRNMAVNAATDADVTP